MDQNIETLTSGLTSISDRLLIFLPKLVAALTIFVVGIYLANLVTRLTVRSLNKRRTPPEVTQFISNYGRATLITLIVITALQQIDFDLTAFIAGLGILGFTLGFALQDITQNSVSGLILLVQRPFEIGDLVKLGEFTGYVRAIDVRSTNIRSLDGLDVVIPNYSVSSNPIINYSKDPEIKIGIEIGVGYDADIEHVRQVTRDAIINIPFVLDRPSPEILFESFDSSSIKMMAYFWINIVSTPEREARNGSVSAIHKAYNTAGISIPYPIQVEFQREWSET